MLHSSSKGRTAQDAMVEFERFILECHQAEVIPEENLNRIRAQMRTPLMKDALIELVSYKDPYQVLVECFKIDIDNESIGTAIVDAAKSREWIKKTESVDPKEAIDIVLEKTNLPRRVMPRGAFQAILRAKQICNDINPILLNETESKNYIGTICECLERVLKSMFFFYSKLLEADDLLKPYIAERQKLMLGKVIAGLRKIEVRLFVERLADVKAQLDKAATKVEQAKSRLAEIKLTVPDAERDLADAKQLLADVERDLADAERLFADAERDLADAKHVERELADAEKVLEENKDTFAEAEKDIPRVEKKLAEAKEALAKAEKEFAEAEADKHYHHDEYDRKKNDLESTRKTVDSLRQNLEWARKRVPFSKTNLEAALERVNSLKKKKENFEAALERVNSLKKKKENFEAALERVNSLKEKKANLEVAIEKANSPLKVINRSYNDAYGDLTSAQNEYNLVLQKCKNIERLRGFADDIRERFTSRFSDQKFLGDDWYPLLFMISALRAIGMHDIDYNQWRTKQSANFEEVAHILEQRNDGELLKWVREIIELEPTRKAQRFYSITLQVIREVVIRFLDEVETRRLIPKTIIMRSEIKDEYNRRYITAVSDYSDEVFKILTTEEFVPRKAFLYWSRTDHGGIDPLIYELPEI
ncbi:MAG: hypothetical protein L0229_09040 [Blastocatellia bacterium]|nr:hypothetical protein [Blastocatellia bacterium]